MTLVEFLLARIAEDQERAEFVQRQIAGQGAPFEAWKLSWHDEYDLLCIEPSRALVECETKRQIVTLYGQIHEVCQLLAAIYAGHPDYQTEWKTGMDTQGSCGKPIRVPTLSITKAPRPGYPLWAKQVSGEVLEPCALDKGHDGGCMEAHRVRWETEYQHLH